MIVVKVVDVRCNISAQHRLLGLIIVILYYSHSLNCSYLLLIGPKSIRRCGSLDKRKQLRIILFEGNNLIYLIFIVLISLECLFDVFEVDICVAQRALLAQIH